ncbi:hypothetical protein GALMADRAFT_224914 [Galerina marginata CBS 339.88]|uniref:Ricin B lectin domain-containing protein n=1 Tax=Galerina marginata (strain CBS 339.88) TaxID=685588 RepID=A0A067TF72_GALM3|nr:hypothetical protein GALMADRAFT_224914 [Galerina marginata CBS 339.88]
MLVFAILAAAALAPTSTLAERLITVTNRCPQAITLYINGQTQGSLATNSITNRTFDDAWSGLIYTDANGGGANGASTTRAGFYGPTNYYYVVMDPNHLNTGVSIVPKVLITADLVAGGFCGSDTCDSTGCPAAYSSPPTSFPVPSGSPPSSPLAECPGTNVGYTVTFCPEKTFPPSSGAVNVHPNGAPNKCLDVRGAIYANGTAVQIYDCNETAAQRWLITKGGGTSAVTLAGTNFCLDAGANPSSGTGLKIWKCINALPAQTWQFTDGNQLQLSTINQCVDLQNGNLSNGRRVQTWTCGSSNANQIWTTS